MVLVTIARYSLRPPRKRVFSSRGGDVRRQELLGGFEQGGLVVPQDQAVVTTLVIENLVYGLVLGVHPVQLHQPPLEVQALDQNSGGGDFVGLFIHRFNPQESLAGLGDGVDQHHLAAANFLAVNHHRVGRGDRSEHVVLPLDGDGLDRKSTRLNSSHTVISYAVFCLIKKETYLLLFFVATQTFTRGI